MCAVKDCYSTEIVGYSITSHMRASLAVSALRNAVAHQGGAPVSDRVLERNEVSPQQQPENS